MHRFDDGQLGRLGAQVGKKALDGGFLPLQLDLRPLRGVADPAGKGFPGDQLVDKGAEAHALYDAVDLNVCANDCHVKKDSRSENGPNATILITRSIISCIILHFSQKRNEKFSNCS